MNSSNALKTRTKCREPAWRESQRVATADIISKALTVIANVINVSRFALPCVCVFVIVCVSECVVRVIKAYTCPLFEVNGSF